MKTIKKDFFMYRTQEDESKDVILCISFKQFNFIKFQPGKNKKASTNFF